MHFMKPQHLLIPALPLAWLLFLVGCANNEVVLCPSASVLSDTANLTVFRTGAPIDPSGEAYTIAITGVNSACHYNKGAREIPTDMSFAVRASRAPSADGADYRVPYYFALTQGDRILSKKNATLTVRFAPGSATATQTVSLDETVINLEEGHPATDYQLLVGFQLSDADRAYNQKRGRFTP
jgi:hypothetical protein